MNDIAETKRESQVSHQLSVLDANIENLNYQIVTLHKMLYSVEREAVEQISGENKEVLVPLVPVADSIRGSSIKIQHLTNSVADLISRCEL